MGNSPTGTQYDNGENLEPATTICVYEDEDADPQIDACINPDHIDAWRECAQIDQQELRMRLAMVQSQLGLVERQAKAKFEHLAYNEPRVSLRTALLFMGQAQDRLDGAATMLRHRKEAE